MRLPSTAAACGIALCTLFLTPSRAAAQPAEPERQTRDRNANNLTIATYEVSDLVVHVPDYTLPTNSALASAQGGGNQGGGMGGMGGYGSMSMMGRGMGMEGGFGGAAMGMPGGSGGQQPVTIDSLRGAIMSVIQPESWAMAQAGGQGRIEVVGTALVVRDSPYRVDRRPLAAARLGRSR
jgi:hypothetical protein